MLRLPLGVSLKGSWQLQQTLSSCCWVSGFASDSFGNLERQRKRWSSFCSSSWWTFAVGSAEFLHHVEERVMQLVGQERACGLWLTLPYEQGGALVDPAGLVPVEHVEVNPQERSASFDSVRLTELQPHWHFPSLLFLHRRNVFSPSLPNNKYRWVKLELHKSSLSTNVLGLRPAFVWPRHLQLPAFLFCVVLSFCFTADAAGPIQAYTHRRDTFRFIHRLHPPYSQRF